MAEKTKKKISIGAVLANVVLVLVIILALYIVICRITGRLPSFFGYSVVTVVTGSMEDTIPENTYILIKKTPADEIEKGDIITFYSDDPRIDGALNTHRVIGIDNSGDAPVFTTMGDNNLAEDDYPVYADKIVGRYVSTLRVMTAVLVFLSNKVVLFSLVILAAIIGVVWLALPKKK